MQRNVLKKYKNKGDVIIHLPYFYSQLNGGGTGIVFTLE